MKKESTNPSNKKNERSARIRSMVRNFRTSTLTCRDHEFISNWLHENESNQLLFESWLLEIPVGPASGTNEEPHTEKTISKINAHSLGIYQTILLYMIFFLVLAALLFAWLF